jgi:hypothetical protein
MPWKSIALHGGSRDSPTGRDALHDCWPILRYAAVLLLSRNNCEVSTISPSSLGSADDHVAGGAGLSMYRFLECNAGQCMTRAVTTVTRDADMRALVVLVSAPGD